MHIVHTGKSFNDSWKSGWSVDAAITSSIFPMPTVNSINRFAHDDADR